MYSGKIPQSSNFLISIYHQDNFSYQGEIQWLDTGKKLRFRSELELLNLIQEACKTTSVKDTTFKGWKDSKNLDII